MRHQEKRRHAVCRERFQQQAAMAEQMLARMGGAAGGGSLFEVTMESSGFSTSAIPDSVFVVPGDYKKVTK